MMWLLLVIVPLTGCGGGSGETDTSDLAGSGPPSYRITAFVAASNTDQTKILLTDSEGKKVVDGTLSRLGVFVITDLPEGDYRLQLSGPNLRGSDEFFHLSSNAVGYYPLSTLSEPPSDYEIRLASEEAYQFLMVMQARALDAQLTRRLAATPSPQGEFPVITDLRLPDGSILRSMTHEVRRTFQDGTLALLTRVGDFRYHGEVGSEQADHELRTLSDGSVELNSKVRRGRFDFQAHGLTVARADGSVTSRWQGPAGLTLLCEVTPSLSNQVLEAETTFAEKTASAQFGANGSVTEFVYSDPTRGFVVTGEANTSGRLSLKTHDRTSDGSKGDLLEEATMENHSPGIPTTAGSLIASNGSSAFDSRLLHGLGGGIPFENLVGVAAESESLSESQSESEEGPSEEIVSPATINAEPLTSLGAVGYHESNSAEVYEQIYSRRSEDINRWGTVLSAVDQAVNSGISVVTADREAAAATREANAELAAATAQSYQSNVSQLNGFFSEIRSMVGSVMSNEFSLASKV